MLKSTSPLILLLLSALAANAQTAAARPDFRGPLPVLNDDYPLGAADHYTSPMDLKGLNYVEEEFIVSGNANIYKWAANNATLEVETPNAPYVNRILVRRPDNRFAFSGTVIVEMFNTARRFDWPMIWGYSADHFIRKGDIWIGVSGPNSVEGLKTFNPARYSDLSFANPKAGQACPGSDRMRGPMENGLKWDMLAQLAAWFKSDAVHEYMPDFEVQRVYLATQNNEIETYINSFHDRWQTEDKGPLYDGYYVKSPGAPAPINDCTPNFAADDSRRQLKDVDVPVVEVLAQGEILNTYWNRKEDSDEKSGPFRRYEVAVAAHIDSEPYRAMPSREDQMKAVGHAQGTDAFPFDVACEPPIPLQKLPLLKFVMNSAFYNLDRWVHYRIRPPYAERITVQNPGADNASLKLDGMGIAEGGVRSPYADAPTATYTTNTGGPGVCRELGATHKLTDAEVAARYGSLEKYDHAKVQAANRMVAERFIDDGDVSEMMADVRVGAPPAPPAGRGGRGGRGGLGRGGAGELAELVDVAVPADARAAVARIRRPINPTTIRNRSRCGLAR